MLGLNHTSPEQTPQLVDSFEGAKVVWADGGQDHTVIVTEKGELWTMGSGGPQLGHGDGEIRKVVDMLLSYLLQVLINNHSVCCSQNNHLIFKSCRIVLLYM